VRCNILFYFVVENWTIKYKEKKPVGCWLSCDHVSLWLTNLSFTSIIENFRLVRWMDHHPLVLLGGSQRNIDLKGCLFIRG